MGEPCSICLENIESHHIIAKPNECNHEFHVACITIWLNNNSTCPMCRRQITYESQVQWRTVIAFAFAFSAEYNINRSLCAFTFLDIILREYPNSRSFKDNIQRIVYAIENLQVTEIKLPFLAITTRTDAIREKRKWKIMAEDLLEEKIQENRLQPFRQKIREMI